MPTMIMKFDLPDETAEFDAALRGADYKALVEDLSNELRNKLKYGTDVSSAHKEIYSEIREKIFTLLEHYGLIIN